MGKIVVLGASQDHKNYSYKAVKALRKKNYEIVALGTQEGMITDVKIIREKPFLADVDTILVYLNPKRQEQHYDYILSLKPRRIIFNPGTNNPELARLAEMNNIQVVSRCALIMLATDSFEA